MAEVPHYVLYEHAVGYALFKIKEFEDAALIIPEVCCINISIIRSFVYLLWYQRRCA